MKTLRQLLEERSRAPLAISPDDSVFAALELMAKHDIGALLVMRDERLAGIFSERDYARKVILSGKSSMQTLVREIMTEDVFYGLPEQTTDQAMALMNDRHIRHLPVLDADKRVIGMLSIGDLVRETAKELRQSRLEAIHLLGRAVEFKDHHTGQHVIRMSHYSQIIALAFTGDELWADRLFHAAAMHDVGKIGVPDRILGKPARLDPPEWEVMQKHSVFGGQILAGNTSDVLQLAQEIAVSHHEQWDGSGYPRGLAGPDIPLSGRIVAIADVFDALTSRRPYKDAWQEDKAVRYIADHADIHFDPELVSVFLEQLPAIQAVRGQYAKDNDDRLTQ
ncbi:MAG: HD domain-containing phosphohydrolase [Sterolibacterium sp.]|jgi:response regulator RpfG family c-di-GMP phosphodiesterase